MATGMIQGGVVEYTNVSVPKNATTQINIAANARYVIFIMGYLINGAVMVQSTGAGAVTFEVLKSNQYLSYSVPSGTTNILAVSNSYQNNCAAYCLIFNGDRPS